MLSVIQVTLLPHGTNVQNYLHLNNMFYCKCAIADRTACANVGGCNQVTPGMAPLDWISDSLRLDGPSSSATTAVLGHIAKLSAACVLGCFAAVDRCICRLLAADQLDATESLQSLLAWYCGLLLLSAESPCTAAAAFGSC
jgi:hypothetical protein